MLVVRLGYTAAVMAGVVWLLLAGRFAEAVFAVVLAVWLRRAVETAAAYGRTA